MLPLNSFVNPAPAKCPGLLGRGTTGREPGECKGTNMGSPHLTDKETEARERQGLPVAPEPAVGRVLGSSGFLHEVYFL